ncbi:MFS transporter [Geodermatophilus sp. URMC 61]|uniref:MFS transporter n=1 Tax=Geodermatophilus sp. URMC 61 TaxID=3423411 RepID=UPI00406D227C
MSTTHRAARPVAVESAMSRRETLEALSGLLMALFVGLLSTTIVANALPTITAKLEGTQSQYTWVVTAALLAATASTPIWGKLADLYSKKLLVQLAIVVFVIGSALCGLTQSMGMLIGFRVLQGIGMGGLQSLVQVVIGAMIPPRERGKYSGYLGAVMAVATVGGPLLGGVIVDTSWLGWRWTFYACVPLALIALVLLQKTLHLPTVRRTVSIDWLGATLVTAAVSDLLIWVTFAGNQFDWVSWQSAVMAGGGLVALLLTVLVESRVREPIIPLPIVRDRTTALAIIASIAVGVGMFGASVFFGQYFQIARGWSPTKAGLATIPMIGALLVSSTVSGQLVTRFGKWKVYLVAGTILLVAGMGLLGTIDHETDYAVMAGYMALLGLGVGMTMQNLVLAVQNTVDLRDIGAATSVVTFFRSMGGAAGVSVLGSIAANRVSDRVAEGLVAMGLPAPQGGGSESLDLTGLPAPVQDLVRAVYGDVIGDVFVIAAVISAVAVLAVLFIKEVPLRRSNAAGEAAPAAADAAPAAGGEAPRVRHTLAAASANGAVPGVNGNGHPADGRVVVGRVLRGDGRPLAGASVTLADVTGRQVDRASSGDDGGYRLRPATGGTYLLIAAAPQLAPNAAMVAVADSAVHRDVVLAGSGEIRGTLCGATGAPLPGALVTLTDVQGEVVGSTTTAADGAFALGELLAGVYTLTAQAPGHQPVAGTVDLPDGGTVVRDLVLIGGARLSGTVRAASDRRPLPEATVTLLDEAGTVLATTRTGGDGGYAFSDLLPGDYTVTASGFAPVAEALRLPAGAEVAHDMTLGALR